VYNQRPSDEYQDRESEGGELVNEGSDVKEGVADGISEGEKEDKPPPLVKAVDVDEKHEHEVKGEAGGTRVSENKGYAYLPAVLKDIYRLR
jgi:hypothetical protein